MAMLIMAVWAVIGGAEGWEDIAEDGKAHAEGCAALLDFPPGLPGPDTLRRGLARVAPAALPRGFSAWPPALRAASGGASVSSDGQTLRHAVAPAPATAAIPMGRAWASANRVVVGHLPGDETAHDLPALPALLRLWALTGAGVTMEALGCQHERAKTMTEPAADAVLALQDPHPTLGAAVTRLLHEARDPGCAAIEHAYHATVAGDHGRLATRR